jgi:two-component system sensor histidine kinase VicK
MILVLLIVTVMTVIGIYLLNSVGTYYEDRFYDKMGEVFTGDFLDVFRDVSSGEDGLVRAEEYILAHSSQLGLSSSRTFALLDARTGTYLTGSDANGSVEKTDNVLAALAGNVGMETAAATGFFDLAVPIADGDGGYIIYIRDDKASVAELQQMLLSAVLQALLFGLVIAVLLSVMLARTISRPIENLTRSAKLVAAGDFTSKPPAYSGDEIGVLT